MTARCPTVWQGRAGRGRAQQGGEDSVQEVRVLGLKYWMLTGAEDRVVCLAGGMLQPAMGPCPRHTPTTLC